MTKAAIRKEYATRRLALSLEEKKKLDELLFSHVQKLLQPTWKTIHVYLPIAEKNEPDTWLLIQQIWKENKRRVVVPKVVGNEMEHFYVEPQTLFQKNKWQIDEPVNARPAKVSAIDCVLVPLLAFDKKLNRVGYGKGFYDKFLAECHAAKIGLSYFPPVHSIDDVSPLDVPLDVVVTPEEIFLKTNAQTNS